MLIVQDGVLTEIYVEGGKVSDHGHTHQSQQSNHGNQCGEDGVWNLCTKHSDAVVAGGVGGEEVVAAGIAESVSVGEECDKETESEDQ